jgi:iron complex outermembrane receptor protein
MQHLTWSSALAVVCLTTFAAGNVAAQSTNDLANLSVDDLMNVQVTSVARRGQRLSETPAAIFVISEEDIHRSGATTIPELLRMVPGFDVSQIDRNVWAVSARGSNGRWANKLLVLIDGRSVYSQLFGSVAWDVQDLPLDDVERIEVTRGPGGTLWGANAVNGIVNIITKHPIDTQGVLASVSHGDGSGPGAELRYGGRFGESGHFRVNLKGFDVPATLRTDDGVPGGNDDWRMLHASLRAEWATSRGSLNLQGDAFSGTSGETVSAPTAEQPFGWTHSDPSRVSGHNLLLRWSSTQSSHSETNLRAYYDDTNRDQWIQNERRRTFDLDFDHHVTLGRHDATWGVEARSNSWKWGSRSGDMLLPSGHEMAYSAFVQDEIRLSSRFRLTVGSKLLNEDGSNQLQPTIRGLWIIRPNQVLWAAATRSVRQPTEIENDVFVRLAAAPISPDQNATLTVAGNPSLRPEHARSLEIGYRGVITPTVSVDVTAFRTMMRDLIFAERGAVAVRDGEVTLPLTFMNSSEATTTGFEALMTIRPATRWDLTLGYTQLGIGLTDRFDGTSDHMSQVDVPRHQYSMRSYFTVTPRLEIDVAAYLAGRIASQNVPRYLRSNLRVDWLLMPDLELVISGQNLTDSHHIEFNGPGQGAYLTPTSRTITGTLRWRH